VAPRAARSGARGRRRAAIEEGTRKTPIGMEGAPGDMTDLSDQMTQIVTWSQTAPEPLPRP